MHVGCHRNVSLIGTRPQSGESKTAASLVISAWQWEPRMGGGAKVNALERKDRNQEFSRCQGWEGFKDSASSEGRKELSPCTNGL